MNTITLARYNDRKEKAKKSSLQWLFSDAANESTVHSISDKREMGVYTKAETKAKLTAGAGDHRRNDSDGLLGSLLLGQLSASFFAAVFGPLLPTFLQNANIRNIADLADEFWLDRRQARSDALPEMTYFPA